MPAFPGTVLLLGYSWVNTRTWIHKSKSIEICILSTDIFRPVPRLSHFSLFANSYFHKRGFSCILGLASVLIQLCVLVTFFLFFHAFSFDKFKWFLHILLAKSCLLAVAILSLALKDWLVQKFLMGDWEAKLLRKAGKIRHKWKTISNASRARKFR